MALNTFGWTPSEVTTDSAGNVISGVTLTVFTDVTKATQVTTLYGKDGVTAIANGVVVSDNKGRFGFKASDTYSMLYVYDGSTADPWPVAAHEALDQGMASHAQAVTAAEAARDAAIAQKITAAAVATDGTLTLTPQSGAPIVATGTTKGPKGDPGTASTIPGPKGEPGGSDQGFADWINTGSSQTRGALNSAVAARAMRQPLPVMVNADPKPVFVSYSPGSLTQSATSTTVSYTDVDATNLKATFVAPPSGKVRIRLRAGAATSGANVQLRWVAAIDGNTVPSSEQIVVQAPATGGTETTSTTVEMVVAVDGIGASGTPLVPGKAYTFTWRQRCNLSGQAGYTRYGSTYGPASIEVIPVVHRITEAPMVATESAAVSAGGFGGHVPLWLCKDGQTILGRAGTGTFVSWSTDDGATWTNHSQGLNNGVQHVRELDNGEIAVFAEAVVGGDNASVWVSSGWAANHATATFTKRLVSGKPGTDLIAWREWSMDTYGPLVFAAEYGPKVSATNMAGQLWMSEDYGITWRVIFDLADPAHSTGVDAHLHGVKYDPFWDAIWLSNGDFVQNAANWISLDRGKTWTKLPFTHQVTNMYPMADCVLFVTDTGNPNGIYRIRRTHPDSLVAEVAYLQDAQTGITMLGTQIFQLRSLPGAPVLMSADAGNVAGQPARLFATYDGYNFREVWKDTQTYINHGLRTMVGPTATGKYHGRLDRVTNYAVDSVVVTLSPPA